MLASDSLDRPDVTPHRMPPLPSTQQRSTSTPDLPLLQAASSSPATVDPIMGTIPVPVPPDGTQPAPDPPYTNPKEKKKNKSRIIDFLPASQSLLSSPFFTMAMAVASEPNPYMNTPGAAQLRNITCDPTQVVGEEIVGDDLRKSPVAYKCKRCVAEPAKFLIWDDLVDHLASMHLEDATSVGLPIKVRKAQKERQKLELDGGEQLQEQPQPMLKKSEPVDPEDGGVKLESQKSHNATRKAFPSFVRATRTPAFVIPDEVRLRTARDVAAEQARAGALYDTEVFKDTNPPPKPKRMRGGSLVIDKKQSAGDADGLPVNASVEQPLAMVMPPFPPERILEEVPVEVYPNDTQHSANDENEISVPCTHCHGTGRIPKAHATGAPKPPPNPKANLTRQWRREPEAPRAQSPAPGGTSATSSTVPTPGEAQAKPITRTSRTGMMAKFDLTMIAQESPLAAVLITGAHAPITSLDDPRILSHIDPSLHQTQALIISPTRTLALHISSHTYSSHTSPIRSHACIGGTTMHTEKMLFSTPSTTPHLVSGTPGRILDMQNRKLLICTGVKLFVVNQVEALLGGGRKQRKGSSFPQDVEQIWSLCGGEGALVVTVAGEIAEPKGGPEEEGAPGLMEGDVVV